MNAFRCLIFAASIWCSACAPPGAVHDHSPSLESETETFTPTALLWEATRAEGAQWSVFAHDLIGNSEAADQLLPGSADVEDFCPRYHSLGRAARVNFWAYLVSAVAKFESGHNPLTRFHESTMGTDPISGEPVHSEGLLQLSYQDIRGYPFCKFDWQKDLAFPRGDPRRTILNPFTNLDCGIRILAQQVHRKGKIALTTGVYWSVLKSGGKYSRLNEISAFTQSLPFCN